MKIALIGQPNCGKSTLFNSVVGYRSETSNLAGTTVQASTGLVKLNGGMVELIDLPGIYSLTTSTPAEATTRQWLWESHPELIINVVDASLLSRSLELTLELRELGIPMVVCLNMMDEAQRKGTGIAVNKLAEMLGIPVLSCVAIRGIGVQQLFAAAKRQEGHAPEPSAALAWSRDVEAAIATLEGVLPPQAASTFPARLLAIRLVEGKDLPVAIGEPVHARARRIRRQIGNARGRDADAIVMSERHDVAMRLFERVAEVGHPRPDIRTRVDELVAHPLLGYVFLCGLLLAFFWGVFGLGSMLERVLQAQLSALFGRINVLLVPGSLTQTIVTGLWDGVVGGAAIVLPYLVPFLVGLALLEDTGYLPRIAYLTDGLLHRVGLHGTSVLPLLLGYGCSVPACLATRVLPSRRDRFLASVLAMLVPCSARSNIIFALIGFYLGAGWALAIFGLNAVVVMGSGWLLTRIWPEVTPGIVLDVPQYQAPQLKVVASKVWLRTRDFIFLSWPLLIIGSVVLGLAARFGMDRWVNAGLSPLTSLLGLPAAVGVTLVFGILRKELSLVMLSQALGTAAVGHVLTTTQLVTFTIFVVFYIPCLATITTMSREIGKRLTAAAVAYSLVLAAGLAAGGRILLSLAAAW